MYPYSHSGEAREVDLSTTLRRGLRVPLRALRAALEDVAAGRSNAALVLPRAIEVLGGVLKEVEVLEDWVSPCAARPAPCTAREIAFWARDLMGGQRSRLLIAFEGPVTRLNVDALLLAKSLARLLDAHLGASGEPVLLHVRTTDEACSFDIVGGEPESCGARDPELAIAAASRDLSRIGAKASFRSAPDRPCARVELASKERV